MSACLLTANKNASGNVCYQHKAFAIDIPQNGEMNFIKHWRKAAGLTLQALGDAIEPPASPGTMQSYEAGTRDVSLKRLQEIARALNVSAGKLLDGPTRLPTTDELISMLEIAQQEVPVGLSLGGYPSAVAASLHEQLRRYVGEPANARAAKEGRAKARAADAPPRQPTRQSARG